MSELSDIWLGSAVVSSDEVGVGTIVSLLVDADGFTRRALVVKHEESLAGRGVAAETFLHSARGGFFKRGGVGAIRCVTRGGDMALFANLTESDIEQLKPPVDGEPAG